MVGEAVGAEVDWAAVAAVAAAPPVRTADGGFGAGAGGGRHHGVGGLVGEGITIV